MDIFKVLIEVRCMDNKKINELKAKRYDGINCIEFEEDFDFVEPKETYTDKAIGYLNLFMNRVTKLACGLEYGEELSLVNYTNILCRLANEINYLENSEEVDNDFCSLLYENGEKSDDFCF